MRDNYDFSGGERNKYADQAKYMRGILRSEQASETGWYHLTLECGHSVEILLGWPDGDKDLQRVGCHKCRELGGDAL